MSRKDEVNPEISTSTDGADGATGRPATSRRGLLRGIAGAGALGIVGLGGVATEARATPPRWDQEAGVVILGYGGAGACAAIEAADTGAKVLILEKQPQASHIPNTRMAGGIFHSPDASGDKAALKEYAKAMFSGENLPWMLEGEQPDHSEELAAVYSELCPQNMAFLKAQDREVSAALLGAAAFPNFPGAKESKYRTYTATYTGKVDYSVPTMNAPKNQKMAGEAFFAALVQGVTKRKVPVLYDTPAKSLIVNDAGAVIGVTAEFGGKFVSIKASRAVVVTTGGYEYSKAMRRAFLEGPGVEGWAFYGSPANTGDGIEMAMRLGAGLEKVGVASSRVVAAVPVRHHGLKMGMITDVVGAPRTVVVDNYGKRYASETLITVDPSRYFFYKEAVQFDIQKLDFTRCPSWLIFDEELRARQSITSLGISTAGYGMLPWTPDNLDAVKRGWILKGDTIEELGEKIKAHADNRKLCDPAVLAKTIVQFNDFCAKGIDEAFGRKANALAPLNKPPYYAIPLYAGGPNTKGGISTNAKREVLDWEGKPIPRLFSAGEISSAFKFVYQSGGNLTECIVFGRVAGKNAAAQKPWA